MKGPSETKPMQAGAEPVAVAAQGSTSLQFAAAARTFGDVLRARRLEVPAFRSPPRVKGRNRTLRRHKDGSATISVVLRGRPWSAVLADMIDGIVIANDLEAGSAQEVRDALWSTVEQIDLVQPGVPSAA